MGVPVCSRRQVLRPELGDLPGLSAKISNIDDNEFFRFFRIYQRKNKVWAAKARVNYLYIVGKCIFRLYLIDYCRTKTIIGKQGISAPCDHDFRVQHGVGTIYWMSF